MEPPTRSSTIHVITLLDKRQTHHVRSPEQLKGYLPATIDVTHSFLQTGPLSVGSFTDHLIASPGVVEEARNAETNKADAIILDCFGDPAIYPCRENVSIPVIGAGFAAMKKASLGNRKFSVVTIAPSVVKIIESNARAYGFGNLMSVRTIDISVLDFKNRHSEVVDQLVEQGFRAVRDDGAEALALGCTGLMGIDREVSEGLRLRGVNVLIVDAMVAALEAAVDQIIMGKSHSKTLYPFPKNKYNGFRIVVDR